MNTLQFTPIVKSNQKTALIDSLRALFQKHGLTYGQIEKRTHGRIGHSWLSKLMSGQSVNPQFDKLLELAALLRVSMGELIGESYPATYRESEFYKLFELYEQIDDPFDRVRVDRYVGDLIKHIEDLVESQKKTSGPRRKEAARK